MEISVSKSAMFFNWSIVVLLLCNGAYGFTVIRSTTLTGLGDVDRFSNPGCYRALCESARRHAECSTADCCLCRCVYGRPNYVVSQAMCKGNDEIDNGCQIGDILSEDLPLPVIEVTKSGKLQFSTPDGCSGPGLQNTRWYYRLASDEWIEGPRNAFSIKSDPINRRILSLQWDKGLEVKYTGLILKIIFTCQNTRNPSCLLMKSKGNFTTSKEGSSDVTIYVSGGRSRPTEPSGTTSRKNNSRDMGSAANSKTKNEVEAKRTGVVIAGVTVSLAFGIALVLVTYLLMLKRRRHERTTKGHRYNTPNVVYEDPPKLPARVQVGTESFHNEFYSSDCVLSISMENIQSTDTVPTRAARMGSLPPVPTQEGIYEEPVIVRTTGYTPLAKESKETHATDDVLSTKEQSLPDYNVLEPPSTDDDDYDDNISECHPREASAIRKD